MIQSRKNPPTSKIDARAADRRFREDGDPVVDLVADEDI